MLACLRLISQMRLHGYMWNERCRSLRSLHHPHAFLYQQLHVMSSAHRIEYLPSMLPTARLRIYLKRPFLHSPHHCTSISPPGETRRWGRTVAHSTKPSTLSSTQAGRSVGATSSLEGDCECGRVVRAHPPVVLRGGLAYEANRAT